MLQFFWIIAAGIAILLNLIFTFVGGLGCHKIAFKTLYAYQIKIMEHIGHLPLGFFSKNTSGGIQKIMDENIEKLEGIIAHMMPDLIGSFTVLLLLFVGIGYLNIIMAVTVLVSVMIAHRLKTIKNAENAKKQSSPAQIGRGRLNANHNRHEADVQKIFYATDSILLFTQ